MMKKMKENKIYSTVFPSQFRIY